MLTRREALIGTTLTAIVAATSSKPVLAAASVDDVASLEHVHVELVAPPLVHPHDQVASGPAKVIEYTMTVHEKETVIDDAGTKMWSMGYNGWIPGPLMVYRQPQTNGHGRRARCRTPRSGFHAASTRSSVKRQWGRLPSLKTG